MTKRCSSCGEELDEAEFARNKNTGDGLSFVCRSCQARYHKAWRAENRNALIESSRKYRERNKERCREAGKRWREKNRARAAELNKAWCAENRPGSMPIDDDDPETDLVPMEAGGFVRWAVISYERRSALGEASPFNGQSIARFYENGETNGGYL